MTKNRTQLAALNVSTAIIYQVFSIVCGLITPRLILLYFGSDYNGVINSAAQFLGLISIFNVGVAGATRVALYSTLANRDNDGTCFIVSSTKKYYRRVGVAILAYTIVLMVVYPFVSHNSLRPYECVLLIFSAGISSFFQYYFGIVNTTLLTADQHDYISSLLDVITLIVATVTTVYLVLKEQSILFVQFASAFVYSVKPFLLNIIVKRKYSLKKCLTQRNDIVIERKSVAMHSVANIVHDQTDIVILTLFTDAKTISVYSVYYLVVGKIKSLMGTFTKGIEGSFGEMYAKKQWDSLNTSFREYEFLMMILVAIFFSCTGGLLIPFISLYTKGVNDVQYIVPFTAFLITITEAVFCIRQPYLLLVQAAGCYKQTRRGAIIEAIINLTLSLIFVRFWGIPGVVLGTLVANVFRTVQYSIYSSRHILKSKYKISLSVILFCVIVSCVCYLLIIMLVRGFPLSGWIGWVFCGAISAILSLTIVLLSSFLFKKELMIRLFNRYKALFRMNRKRNND